MTIKLQPDWAKLRAERFIELKRYQKPRDVYELRDYLVEYTSEIEQALQALTNLYLDMLNLSPAPGTRYEQHWGLGHPTADKASCPWCNKSESKPELPQLHVDDQIFVVLNEVYKQGTTCKLTDMRPYTERIKKIFLDKPTNRW